MGSGSLPINTSSEDYIKLSDGNSRMKILFLDIETSPILSYVWGLWENNVSLNQIKSDWYVLSWCAKWSDSNELMYMDQRDAKKMEDDKKILKGIWKLLDEADMIVTQNGKKFDAKKLNARFVIQGFQPPSSYKHYDTREMAKKYFAFTSTKLEYMSEKLCTKYKKLKHEKYPGFELWKECLAGNKEAWEDMEKYNKHDVLALEELYKKLVPWGTSINPSVYHENSINECTCGATRWLLNGHFYSANGKYQRYKCRDCGAERRDKQNKFDVVRKVSLRVPTR